MDPLEIARQLFAINADAVVAMRVLAVYAFIFAGGLLYYVCQIEEERAKESAARTWRRLDEIRNHCG